MVDHDLDSRNIKSKIAIDSDGIDQVRPDAWIKFKNGQQVAIEYQYSVGDPKRVIEKTRAYRNSNTAVWWVFSGRSPKTCINVKPARHVSRYGGLVADLSAPQKALADKAIPFFWFDYESARLATPVVYARVLIKWQAGELWGRESMRTQKQYVRSPRRYLNSWARIFEHSLEECAVDLGTGALVTPGTRAIARDAPRIAADIEELRAQARERFKAAAQRRNRREATPEVQLAQKSSEVHQPISDESIESVSGDGPGAEASSDQPEATVALRSATVEAEGERLSLAMSDKATTADAADRQARGWGIWRKLKQWFTW
ncbi:competence protein CoiA family protein [Kocuria sp. SL71]|uniref:competence protein CoiA family protein n=1 Tax=Kocuria sp. SL71 TaxID=2995151 RepID=UPI003FA36BC7